MDNNKRIGIINGAGAIDLLEAFLGAGEIKITGVLDQDKNSRFAKIAKESKIFVSTDPVVFFHRFKGKTVIDFSDGWYKKIIPLTDESVKIVDPEMSELLLVCVKDRKRLTRTQSALERVSEIIVSRFDLSKILNLVIYIASRLLKVEICSVRLLDSNGKLSRISSSGLSRKYLKKGDLRVGESIAGWVVKNKKSYISQDLERDSRYKFSSFAEKEGIKSLLCMPLIVKNCVIGVLSVYSSVPRKFNLSEVRLFTAFAFRSVVKRNSYL